MKKVLESKIKNVRHIREIRGDASERSFFRIFFNSGTAVAMVYPPGSKQEIEKVLRLTGIYRKYQIPVPRIIDVIDDRIVILDDLGGESIQKRFAVIDEKSRKDTLIQIVDTLRRINQIPVDLAENRLDKIRMTWEMDFFITHFAKNFFKPNTELEAVRMEIHSVVNGIGEAGFFLHRDFHSRNMLFHNDQVHLVDFQDSLAGPEYYDLVSFAFDAYLDLKSRREFLFRYYGQKDKPINSHQLYLTALQRNIKALGTFGFQIVGKKNLRFRKYIPRTIRHIMINPLSQSRIPTLISLLRVSDVSRPFR